MHHPGDIPNVGYFPTPAWLGDDPRYLEEEDWHTYHELEYRPEDDPPPGEELQEPDPNLIPGDYVYEPQEESP